MSADLVFSDRSGHGKMSGGVDAPPRRDAGAGYDGDDTTSRCVSAGPAVSGRSGHGKKSDGADTPLRRDAGAEKDGLETRVDISTLTTSTSV